MQGTRPPVSTFCFEFDFAVVDRCGAHEPRPEIGPGLQTVVVWNQPRIGACGFGVLLQLAFQGGSGQKIWATTLAGCETEISTKDTEELVEALRARY